VTLDLWPDLSNSLYESSQLPTLDFPLGNHTLLGVLPTGHLFFLPLSNSTSPSLMKCSCDFDPVSPTTPLWKCRKEHRLEARALGSDFHCSATQVTQGKVLPISGFFLVEWGNWLISEVLFICDTVTLFQRITVRTKCDHSYYETLIHLRRCRNTWK
jgi:hypothetical protein